jgi:hypothetical protein
MTTKKIAPSALIALQDALASIYWYKKDLRSFLISVIEDRSILSSLNWNDFKRNIVRDLITYLERNQDRYLEDLIRLLIEVARINDFTHLERLEDGKVKAQNARKAVESLRKSTANHVVIAQDMHDAEKRRSEAKTRITQTTAVAERLDELKLTYLALVTDSDHQGRGFKLEKIIRQLFDIFDLDPKASFKIVGEQIDGAFTFDGTDYLFEAKWQKAMVKASDLDSLAGKLSRKLDNTLGLFLSMNGFSDDGLEAHTSGKRVMLLMDGSDLMAVLEGRIELTESLLRKRRHASQTGNIFLRIYETL